MISNTGSKNNTAINVKIESLSKSSPAKMDPRVIEIIKDVANSLRLRTGKLFSAAGHDTQNAAKAGIKVGMFFIPSRSEGIPFLLNFATFSKEKCCQISLEGVIPVAFSSAKGI